MCALVKFTKYLYDLWMLRVSLWSIVLLQWRKWYSCFWMKCLIDKWILDIEFLFICIYSVSTSVLLNSCRHGGFFANRRRQFVKGRNDMFVWKNFWPSAIRLFLYWQMLMVSFFSREDWIRVLFPLHLNHSTHLISLPSTIDNTVPHTFSISVYILWMPCKAFCVKTCLILIGVAKCVRFLVYDASNAFDFLLMWCFSKDLF